MASLTSKVVGRSLLRLVNLAKDVTADSTLDDIDVQIIRDRLENMAKRQRVPRGATLEITEVGGVPGEWLVHPAASVDRVLLWVHGGAYCLCSPRTHRTMALSLSRWAGARVFVPDYGLAPEVPFPGARDQVQSVLAALREDPTVDPSRLAIGGDSSGGGLVMSVLIAERDAGFPLPTCAVLFSPWVDLASSGPTVAARAARDPLLPLALAHLPAMAYAGELALDDPLVSPVHADLHGMPPMLVHVGTEEFLYDEGHLLVDRVRAAGGAADLGVWDGVWHVFQAFPMLPESRRALREAGGFIRRHIPDVALR